MQARSVDLEATSCLMSLAANLSVEPEGSPHAEESFLERGILRNKKTFKAVFDRIYEKVRVHKLFWLLKL